jgi:hypothetical protein
MDISQHLARGPSRTEQQRDKSISIPFSHLFYILSNHTIIYKTQYLIARPIFHSISADFLIKRRYFLIDFTSAETTFKGDIV